MFSSYFVIVGARSTIVYAVSRKYVLIEHCRNCSSSNSLGSCLGCALWQFASGIVESRCDAPEVSVVKAADACASHDLSHIFANESG